MDAEAVIDAAHGAGVRDRDTDLKRSMATATARVAANAAKFGDRPQGDWRHYAPRAKPKPPPTFPRYVRDMVAAGGGEATSADLRALSPFAVPTDAGAQTAAFLRSLFDPADVLHVFRDDAPTAGKPGQNLMPCRDWLAMLERGEKMNGDLIVANVFSGAAANTTDGRKSFIAQSCLARFPFAVVEFDSMPLKVQAAFWRGLLMRSPLAPKVASITYSGGKSLHGLLHVGCRTLVEWQTVREQLRGLLAADPDPAFRADEQAMRPRTGTRLSGVRRFDNGRRQTLLYLNPEAVRPMAGKPDAPTVRVEPRETPQTRPPHETGKESTRADGRATEQISALLCNRAPLPPTPPTDNAPLDEILAYFDVIESMAK